MDRYWLLTSTTYGTWLPGDKRGFVSYVREEEGKRVIHNIPGTAYDEDEPSLKEFAYNELSGKPVLFVHDHASVLFQQIQETATIRRWLLLAVGIMNNHFHIVVGVSGDPSPSALLRDFKAYGSRALNRAFEPPKSGTWWTESGSKRKLPKEVAVLAAIEYVRNQPNPLLIWIAPGY